MNRPFGLFVFTVKEETVRAVSAGGAAGIIVDWERMGKEGRQRGFDTEINSHDEQDLANVRSWTDRRVICRIDRHHDWALQKRQIDQVMDLGGDEILLPMVREVQEPERVLDYVANHGGVGVGILVETRAAVELRHELATLPLSRVYVGLNDLAIDMGSNALFEPLASGLLEEVLSAFPMPAGFGGLTLPKRGSPIPCRLLMAALLGLGCRFTFLRRSFFRDTQAGSRDDAVREILQAIHEMQMTEPGVLSVMQSELVRMLRNNEAMPNLVQAVCDGA